MKAVEGLTAQIVGNNAKIKTIEEVLATKADKVEFVDAVVLLTGKINDKADLAKANANATEIAAVKATAEKAAADAAEALKDVAKAQSTADAALAAANKAQSTADEALAK